MSITDDGPQTNRARHPLNHLRRTLQEARDADDAERVHVALIDAVDGLITHAERQARAIEDMRSDLSHKQGVVTKIGGGDFAEPISRPSGSGSSPQARMATAGISAAMRRAGSPTWSIRLTCLPAAP